MRNLRARLRLFKVRLTAGPHWWVKPRPSSDIHPLLVQGRAMSDPTILIPDDTVRVIIRDGQFIAIAADDMETPLGAVEINQEYRFTRIPADGGTAEIVIFGRRPS